MTLIPAVFGMWMKIAWKGVVAQSIRLVAISGDPEEQSGTIEGARNSIDLIQLRQSVTR